MLSSKRFIVLAFMFMSLLYLSRLILSRTWIEGLGYLTGWLGGTGPSALISLFLRHSFYLGLAVVFDFYIFPLAKTVNPNILQYGLESLTRKTSYTLQVMASTSAGGTNGTKINFKTLSISEYFLYALHKSPWHFPYGSWRWCLLKAGEA